MMHEDVDDEEEDVILDRRTLIHQANDSLSNSGPILLGVNRFNIKVYDDPVKLSQTKAILLAATCISIGMFMGLLSPTFPFLAQRMPADLSEIIWLIGIKAIGFLIGTFISAYLYAWFNVCCLLGLSCLAISFGVCSLTFITDLATFYLTSLILGIGLAISYNGIDTLYNRLWTRPSLTSVRWLHLLVAFGAILSTLMLFPSAISSNKNDSLLTNVITQSPRVPRQIGDEIPIADRLASMPSPPIDNEDMLSNITNTFNQSNNTYTTSDLFSKTTTTTRLVLKPQVVDTGDLKQSIILKPPPETDQSNKQLPICIKIFCCYHYNNTNQNETILNNPFSCQDKAANQSNDCKTVLSTCQTSTSKLCLIDKTDISCRIDEICGNDKTPECSIQLIKSTVNANSSTTVLTTTTTTVLPKTTTATTVLPNTTPTTVLPSTTTPVLPTTSTTTVLPTTMTTITTTTTVTSTTTTKRRHKPMMAESNSDELSENLFYIKIRSFYHSITSIHMIYLFLAFLFFLLGIFYSTLAIRGEGKISSPTKSTNRNPLLSFFGNSDRIVNNSNNRISLLSDRDSLKFVLLLILFYLLIAGIESSCIYLTYLFGIGSKLDEKQSLSLQFLFFFGLLLGRLIDILMDYSCFLFNTRITNRTKKQSDKFHLISIKFCILIRLILLFVLCSTLSFSHLVEKNSSNHMFYLIFFLIGLLIASIPTLILFWIERDLSLNDSLIKIIFVTITISEIIFPSFLFYIIKRNILSYVFYLFIGSCLLLILFIFILYISKKWQRKKSYRILPTSMEMDEVNIENNSDDDDDDYYLTNGRMNLNESKINLDNERTKGLKGH